MTRRSILGGVSGGEGRVQAEAWALLDYDAARPPESGSSEARDLTASSLPLLDCARTNRRAVFVIRPTKRTSEARRCQSLPTTTWAKTHPVRTWLTNTANRNVSLSSSIVLAPLPTDEPIFVTASHQTGLDTRSMTRRSIKVWV